MTDLNDEILNTDLLKSFQDMFPGFGGESGHKLKTQLAIQARSDREMAATISRLFRTDDGQKVLAWLYSLTRGTEILTQENILTMSGDQMKAWTLLRSGENSVVNLILEAVAMDKTYQQTEEEEDAE